MSKQKNDKYKIKPIGKQTNKAKNLFANETDSRIPKKNYSESPSIKKNYFNTDNNNNDINPKSNDNKYKRNKSSNLNTISNTHYNNQLNEESIELIIPTPYPKNVLYFDCI